MKKDANLIKNLLDYIAENNASGGAVFHTIKKNIQMYGLK